MFLRLLTSSMQGFRNLKTNQYDRVVGLVSARLVDTDGDFSHILQRKSRLQMILLSCAVCGIEFCYAAETAFVSPILLKIGVPVLYMTLIWCLSPILGFLLVPMLGSISDRCGSRMGRRRPFILALSVGIVIGLIFVSNGRDIGVLLGDKYHNFFVPENNLTINWSKNFSRNATDELTPTNLTFPSDPEEYHTDPQPWSILFTVLGVVMLDFNCDACQSPCRAYLLDVTVPADHPAGLSTFTVMAGLGGFVGYVIGGINWKTTVLGESFGGHVKVVFTLVLLIYIVCLCLTIVSVKEVPLAKLGITKEDLQKKKKKVHGVKYNKFANESDSDDEGKGDGFAHDNANTATYGSQDQTYTESKNSHQNGTSHTGNGPVHCIQPAVPPETANNDTLQFLQTCDGKKKEELELSQSKAPKDLPLALPSEISVRTYLMSIVRMPRSLALLCITNLFCWMSLVCYSLYFTDFVGQAVYGGDPRAPPNTEKHELYEKGVRIGSLGMSLYSLACSMYSMCLESLVKRFKARPVYIFSQLVYTVGATLMAATRNYVSVIVLSPCAGVMYATLFTMPYLLVAHYHSNDTFSKETPEDQRSLEDQQIRGLGTDVALVSSMVFVAQFLLSACMGSIIHATGTTASVMAAAAILSFLGSCSASQLLYLDL